MPINTRWNIAALLAAVRQVPQHRRRFVTFEYVLFADVNDSDDDVGRLAALVGDMRCQINVIPFNPHPHAPYRRPAPARVHRFLDRCRALGLHAYLRTPRGDDIGAACASASSRSRPGPSRRAEARDTRPREQGCGARPRSCGTGRITRAHQDSNLRPSA